MPGPIVHNQTTAADQGGFVAIPSSLTHRGLAMEEPPEYVVYQERTSGDIRHFWAKIHIYGRSITQERPHRFTISREGCGRPIQVASGDHETDLALLHLVRYVRVQEALYDQDTLDLIAPRAELARLRRRKAEPEASNPVLLFGRPIELQRSVPAADPSHAPISPEELRRIFGISSNVAVDTTPRNGHPRYPDLVAPPPSPSNRDAVVPKTCSPKCKRSRLSLEPVVEFAGM
ncbi:hypothetical protein D1007_45352 [Hordeum vulgare]|nr:hypothetical protein D1007_45352 [Hordeum vulgare]